MSEAEEVKRVVYNGVEMVDWWPEMIEEAQAVPTASTGTALSGP